LRPDLASLVEFDAAMDRQKFIGYRVAPVVEVSLASDNPGKIPLKELLQDQIVTRAADGSYHRSGFKFDKWSYATEEYGHEVPIDRRLRNMYARLIDSEVVATGRAVDIVTRAAEIRVATLLFNATTWTGATLTTAVGIEWSTIATAVPITNVAAAKKIVRDGSGLDPNALILNLEVFENLRRCAQIIDRIESAGAGTATKAADITAEMLARCFDLDEVIVAGGFRNTANPGQAASLSRIWSGEYAMLARIGRTSDVQEACVARTFHWGEDGSQVGGLIERYYSDEVRADVVRCRHDVDELVMYTAAAHLLSNITA
jgi:hypothetical protein